MIMHRHLAAATLAVAVASPAMALEAHKSVMVDGTPEQAWAAIGDFCGIAGWHPAIEKCELGEKNGKPIRTLSLKGGGTIVEEETAHAKNSYSYTILSGPLPVEKYRSTLKVEEMGGTMIDWSGKFAAKGAPDAKAKEVIDGIYQAGLDSLASKLKK